MATTTNEVKPLYSTCVAVLGFVCLVIGAAAVGIPMWGYFDTYGWGLRKESTKQALPKTNRNI